MKRQQDILEYQEKLKELIILLYLESQGFLKVYFADESGFSLTPCIPYGWQAKGEYIRMTPQRSQTTNVFGLLSRDNSFEAYTTEQSINAEAVIVFVDDFAKRITQPTVIVLDNSPVHRSEAFESNIPRWQEEDLYIFFLPKYSPHLNLIETLWRKIKYEWLKPHHYLNRETLLNALNDILVKIGNEFTINFKEQKVSIIFD